MKDNENANKIFHAISNRNENVGMAKYVKFSAFTKQKQLEHELRQKKYFLILAGKLRQKSGSVVVYIARHREILA